jgi:hypothetical protein
MENFYGVPSSMIQFDTETVKYVIRNRKRIDNDKKWREAWKIQSPNQKSQLSIKKTIIK